MSFFERPILNSPYDHPGRHWELDDDGQPTNRIIDTRRRSELITPVPQSKKGKKSSRAGQGDLLKEEDGQEYVLKPIVNQIRAEVDAWRRLPSENQWRVTPHTARLLHHWREHQFNDVRPFFCQLEAAETAIWLAEVASRERPAHVALTHLQNANGDANPELFRIALKLATGAGKTTVMAMLIAWQTINAVRMPGSNRFSRSFLIVAPGITIRDRLRVLLPNDPENYYRTRELVPQDMLDDVLKAKIVVTNYHAFKHRVTTDVARGTQKAIEGRDGKMALLETEGQMLRRIMPELMHDKAIVVINDEAHHCYRERPLSDEEKLKGDEKKEADENNAAARLWISGLESIRRHRGMGIRTVYDLSATPFFLRGSGYREGTLFPWTVSDFSLVDAIESGIVKLPRVPIADNIPGGDMPQYRNLWDTIGKKMPKKGLLKGGKPVDPHSIPIQLQTALEALYGHYAKVFDLWEEKDIGVPPVFIVVCNNTTTSKLVHDYISGFFRHHEDDSRTFEQGRLKLFRNYDDNGERLARPRTLLIDSAQLESGEALDRNFREIAADEIDHFKRDIIERTGDRNAADNITDQDLLREVMNTVGKKGRLGESIRCVVSVSMLTEGWDANTVTHILGVRAFGTQLLCEQVVGRGLRRQSYEVDPDTGLFDAEYADILGIPFDFTAQPVVAPPKPPKKMTSIRAVRPERDHLEIRFPRVRGYRVDLPPEKLVPSFTAQSKLDLTPDLVGATKTVNGSRQRRNGILNNELYRGNIIYNRQSFVKDPETGKRVSRPNPEADWITTEVPHLQIIDEETWEAAQTIKDRYSSLRGNRRQTKKRLLSGFIRCGACGGTMTIVNRERYSCSAKRERGTCSSPAGIQATEIEERVIDGLRRILIGQQDLIDEFASAYRAEIERLRGSRTNESTRLRKELAKAQRGIERCLAYITDGDGDPGAVRQSLKELERRKKVLDGQLRQVGSEAKIEIHPNIAELYRRKVTELHTLLADDTTRHQAMDIIRSLVDRIEVHPGEKRGKPEVILVGTLANILEYACAQTKTAASMGDGGRVLVVAGQD